jgi:hypothetical protein
MNASRSWIIENAAARVDHEVRALAAGAHRGEQENVRPAGATPSG